MKTIEIKVNGNRYYNIIAAIEKACKKVNANFSYEVGFARGHQAKRLTVWIDGIRRTNCIGVRPEYGYFNSHGKLLNLVINLFQKKYAVKLSFLF